MTNLLGKCTKYQPFSGKKKRNLANFHRTFSVMSGEPRCCQAYLVSTPPAHPGALGPKMEDEALSKWLNGEHHEPLDFGVFPLQFSDPFWVPGNISFPIYVQLAVAKLLLGSEGSRVDKTWQASSRFSSRQILPEPSRCDGAFNLRVFMERRSVAWIPMIRYDSYTQMCQSPAFVGPNCQLSHEQNTLLSWLLGIIVPDSLGIGA